jgi:hypothetical protein
MAHHSYSTEFQVKSGLQNQLSVNANQRNKKAMSSLDNLEALFHSSDPKDDVKNKESKGDSLLNEWRDKRNSTKKQ